MDAQTIAKFKQELPTGQLKVDEPLAMHTTLRIGGPADLFFVAKSEVELISAVKLAQRENIEFVILGWGSNVLVSDAGFRGLVIKNQSQDIQILNDSGPISNSKRNSSEVDRHEHAVVEGKNYQTKFDDIDYDESHLSAKLVNVSSGVPLGKLISWSFDNGLTGLQWFNRIPGTIGGAIFNNIHGGAHYFEEVIHEVHILNKKGEHKTLLKSDLQLGYDKSRFHNSNETIISATLKLYTGDVTRAKSAAIEWAKRKSNQPHNSAGCTFKNISQADREKLGYPTTSVGYIIEWVLKFSHKNIGDAVVSSSHHAFIENNGKATAQDVLTLIKQIKTETKSKTGLDLTPEIFFIGFDNNELINVV